MFNILVTGVGSVIGYGIIDGLKRSSLQLNVTGIDIYDDAYGGFIADEFVQDIRADKPGFIANINSIIRSHNIDLVMPGIEADLYQLWEHRDCIAAPVVLGNPLCMALSQDKRLTYDYLHQFDIDLIPTLYDCDFSVCEKELGIPFLFKPVMSSASKGIEKIYTEDEFSFFTRRSKGRCIYQRIVGCPEEEFTCALFGDGKGGFFDHIILRRKLSGDGSTNKATLDEDEKVLAYIQKLCAILKPEGPLNIQIRKEGDRVYLLEINCRVSSSCSIRTMMGYNEPEMCVRYFLLHEQPCPGKRKAKKAVRYIADFIIE